MCNDWIKLIRDFLIAVGIVTAVVYALPLEAQSVKIRVVGAVGKGGFSCQETLDYYKMAAYIIESQPGIRLRFRYRCIKNLINEGTILNRFYLWRSKYSKKKKPLAVVASPYIKNDIFYTAGLAFIGLKQGFSLSFVMPQNQIGEDRRQWAIVTIAHEIAHMLGARHDETQGSIMSTNALYRLYSNPNQTLSFSQASIRQIRKEIRNKKKNKLIRNKSKCLRNITGVLYDLS